MILRSGRETAAMIPGSMMPLGGCRSAEMKRIDAGKGPARPR